MSSQKIPGEALPSNLAVADATTVDVYKNCHAVLLLVDPTRKWTFEYAQKEVKKIPDNVQVRNYPFSSSSQHTNAN